MIAVQSSLFFFIVVYVYRSLSLLRLSSGRSILPRLHKKTLSTILYASDGDHDDNAETLIEYGGLESSLENMETGVAIEELGLLVCVGPSLVSVAIPCSITVPFPFHFPFLLLIRSLLSVMTTTLL